MKRKSIYVALAALLLSAPLSLSAQEKDEKVKKERPTQEQLQKMQANQMVKVLMLDDATAAKFVPVYEKYLQELRAGRATGPKADAAKKEGQEPAAAPERKKPEAMSDKEVGEMLKEQFAQSRKMLDVREKYYAEFSKFLSQKQIMRIYMKERDNMDRFRHEFDNRKMKRSGENNRRGEGGERAPVGR